MISWKGLVKTITILNWIIQICFLNESAYPLWSKFYVTATIEVTPVQLFISVLMLSGFGVRCPQDVGTSREN